MQQQNYYEEHNQGADTYGYGSEADKLVEPKDNRVSRRTLLTAIVGTAAVSAAGGVAGGVALAERLFNRRPSSTAADPATKQVSTPNVGQIQPNRAPTQAELARQRSAVVEGFVNDHTLAVLASAEADKGVEGITNESTLLSNNGTSKIYARTRTAMRAMGDGTTRRQVVQTIYGANQAGTFEYGSATSLEAITTVLTPKGDYLASRVTFQHHDGVNKRYPEGWLLSTSGTDIGSPERLDTAQATISPDDMQHALQDFLGPRYIDPALE